MPLKIEKRGSIWWAYGTVAGRRIRRSLKTRDRGIAEEKRAQIETRLHREQVYGRDAVALFEEAALDYMKVTGQQRFMVKLIEHFAGVPVSTITPQVIQDAAAQLYPNATHATRRRQAITPINAILNHFHGRRPQAREEEARTAWLTPEDAERLIEKADTRTRRMILFLLSSGVRTGEMLALDRHDIRPETGQAWIDAEKEGAGKTGASRWASVERRGLEAALGGAPEVGRLFLTPKGKPYVIRDHGGGQIAGTFNKARDAAGLGKEITPHVLRHTWATWFYSATGAQLELERFGGWASAAMVRRYTKLAPGDLPSRLKAFGWDFEGARRAALGIGVDAPKAQSREAHVSTLEKSLPDNNLRVIK